MVLITENLSTLKIHKLTQEQYDRELAAGNIDANALYLTPDEEIDLTPYAPIDSPEFTGSISLGRKSGTTVGRNSFAVGYNVEASGNQSHAEGENTTASGNSSHAEGHGTTASGYCSHAEGIRTIASGNYSHAEGWETTASGNSSHAEGYKTTASEVFTHAEGHKTTASGNYSHAEGDNATASGQSSHAEGIYTIASSKCQHVQGKFNIEDADGIYANIVGNGAVSSTNSTEIIRSNAHTLDWSGNAWYAGDVYVGGTSQADATALGAAISQLSTEVAKRYPDWSHLKWYVMGDSLTAQDNAFTNKRYYDFIQEKTGIQVIVDGVGATGYKAGESESQSFLDRVQNIPEDVDIVTIFGSGNDLTSTDTEYANDAIWLTLSWLVLNRTGLRVIVVPPSPWRNYDKRGEVWKAYCDRLQVCALACDFRYLSDMYDCPPINGKYDSHVEKFFTTDPNGIHPNEEGHKALAPFFYNALLQELALKV